MEARFLHIEPSVGFVIPRNLYRLIQLRVSPISLGLEMVLETAGHSKAPSQCIPIPSRLFPADPSVYAAGIEALIFEAFFNCFFPARDNNRGRRDPRGFRKCLYQVGHFRMSDTIQILS